VFNISFDVPVDVELHILSDLCMSKRFFDIRWHLLLSCWRLPGILGNVDFDCCLGCFEFKIQERV
jgi:hypothetical protein